MIYIVKRNENCPTKKNDVDVDDDDDYDDYYDNNDVDSVEIFEM